MAGHDRLTDEGKRFFAQIKELEQLQVRVGFQAGEAAEKDGVDIANIAMWNEVGTSRAPARPFLRPSVDDHKEDIAQVCKAYLQKLAKGEVTAQQILSGLGSMQVGLVQDKILDGPHIPNAPSTLSSKLRKGLSEKPLIATGSMKNHVTFVIKPKGEGDD